MEERLSQINGELKRLNGNLARQARLEAQLADLQDQRAERQARVEETARIFREEQEDVDQLEKGGLRALFLRLAGDKEERLSQEKREALAAKFQYDQALQDLEDIYRRAAGLLREQDGLHADRARRDALLEEKGELLKRSGGAAGVRLAELDQQMDALERQLREVAEAASAGRQAEAALSDVLDSLDSAAGWGTWDMLGGGMFVTMAKHDRLNDAQAGIGYAQQCLSRFRTELADVREMDIPQVQVGQFATFADYFFDGLFADWYVQSRIQSAQDGVSDSYRRVRQALESLWRIRKKLERRQSDLEAQRQQLLQEG